MPLIRPIEVRFGDEFLARRQQISAHVALVPDIVMGEERLEAIPALAQIFGVFAPLFLHPLDEGRPVVRERRGVPVIGERYVRHRRQRKHAARELSAGAEQKETAA